MSETTSQTVQKRQKVVFHVLWYFWQFILVVADVYQSSNWQQLDSICLISFLSLVRLAIFVTIFAI